MRTERTPKQEQAYSPTTTPTGEMPHAAPGASPEIIFQASTDPVTDTRQQSIRAIKLALIGSQPRILTELRPDVNEGPVIEEIMISSEAYALEPTDPTVGHVDQDELVQLTPEESMREIFMGHVVARNTAKPNFNLMDKARHVRDVLKVA